MSGRVQPGDVLGGKYAVEAVIGQGGTGYVVAAQHLVLRRRVALKFLRPELAVQSELGHRFLREAQAAAQMTGDHVARVMDADTLPTGEPYLVMEFLEGEDIAAILRRSGPLSFREAAEYIVQACDAVREAHALHIVHRDLKPSNLFLTTGPNGEPRIKVLDFGVSKVLGSGSSQSLTGSDHVVGSPHYMSPEQVRTPREVDERTDIWSLGATLFTMLTGHVPFDGRSMIEVCGALLCGPPPRVGRFRADVPEGLEQVVLRCLRIDPAERFESASALARELAPFTLVHPSAIGDRPRTSSGLSDAGALVSASQSGAPAGRPPAHGRAAVVFGAIALSAAAFVALVPRLRGPSAERSVPSAEVRPREIPAAVDSARDPRSVSGPNSSSMRDPAGGEESPLSSDLPPAVAAVGSAAKAAPAVSSARARLTAQSSAPSGRPSAAPAPCGTCVPATMESGTGQGGPARPARSTSPAPSCPDPFYVDEHGIKTIRPECL
jgi:serine/threonine-protein kinase